jgi:hypothetical protein
VREVTKDKTNNNNLHFTMTFRDCIVQDIAFLQQVYSSMNEVDCMIGLADDRSTVTLAAQITEFEATVSS